MNVGDLVRLTNKIHYESHTLYPGVLGIIKERLAGNTYSVELLDADHWPANPVRFSYYLLQVVE